MGQEARDAWAVLARRLEAEPLTLLGDPLPSRELLDRARRAGAVEGDPAAFEASTRAVVVPMTGMPLAVQRGWKEAGHELVDLTLPSIRRLRATLLSCLRAGDETLLAGGRDDAEARFLLRDCPGLRLIEEADEVVTLGYATRISIACTSQFPGRRLAAIAGAVRGRFRDARVEVIDTRTPEAAARERTIEKALGGIDGMLLVADPADPGRETLAALARAGGCPVVGGAGEARLIGPRILLAAPGYTPPEALARALEKLAHPSGRDRLGAGSGVRAAGEPS